MFNFGGRFFVEIGSRVVVLCDPSAGGPLRARRVTIDRAGGGWEVIDVLLIGA